MTRAWLLVLAAAETDAQGIERFEDRSRPAESMGRLYARAGYLAEAERNFKGMGRASIVLIKADAFYGDLPAAEREVERIVTPVERVEAEAALGDLLWRMGDVANARKRLAGARMFLPKVKDETRREALARVVRQSNDLLSEAPPRRIAPAAQPWVMKNAEVAQGSAAGAGVLPPFPITTDGFGEKPGPKERNAGLEAKQALLTRLYERVAARDLDGLNRLVDETTDPFQKILIYASIENFFIQARPAAAEQVVALMPEADDECVLAKSEAVNSVAGAWLRAGEVERARGRFAAARSLAEGAKGLPFGQVTVLSEIGEAEGREAQLMKDAEEALRSAARAAESLPVFHFKKAGEPARPKAARQEYRDEAYRTIFQASAHVADWEFAKQLGEKWAKSMAGGGAAVVGQWIWAKRPEDAMAFVKSIEDREERAQAEIQLARALLTAARVPEL